MIAFIMILIGSYRNLRKEQNTSIEKVDIKKGKKVFLINSIV